MAIVKQKRHTRAHVLLSRGTRLRGEKLSQSRNLQKEPIREGTMQAIDIKGKIVEFAWQLKKDGVSETTIENYVNSLRRLIGKGGISLIPIRLKE